MSEKLVARPPLDPAEADLLRKVDDAREELLGLLERLVNIDSRTHDLDTYSDMHEIATFVTEWMDSAGATTTVLACPHGDGKDGKTWPSVLSSFGSHDGPPALQFCGHMDVVPFTEDTWEEGLHPLKAVVKDGRLYGRGAADMKGGIAAQMMACKILAASGHELVGKLQMLFVPDEEINGDYGAQFLADHHKDAINAGMTIIAEPTGQPPVKSPTIIMGEKGHLWTILTFHGASGHGSMPKPRSNAINKATTFIARASKQLKLPKVKPPLSMLDMVKGLLIRFSFSTLVKLVKDPGDGEKDPFDEDGVNISNFFKNTISFNEIRAGTKINVIPDTCEVFIDIRVLPGIDLQDVIDSIAAYCTKLGYRLAVPDGHANIQHDNATIQRRPVDVTMDIVSWTPGTFVQPNNKTRALALAFEDVFQTRAVYFFSPGGTDAAHMRPRGIENVVIFGPAGGNTHDANEYVDIDSLVKVCKVHLLHAYRMLCKPREDD